MACTMTDEQLGAEPPATMVGLTLWQRACDELCREGYLESAAHAWLWNDGDWLPRVRAVLALWDRGN